MLPLLIDTHTHFDEPVFADDRELQAKQSWHKGVRHLLLVGYLCRHFQRLLKTQTQLVKLAQNNNAIPQTHSALGLHPFYIQEHTECDLQTLADYLDCHNCHTNSLSVEPIIALGEIGLDTFTAQMKQPDIYQKQQQFFVSQLDLAVKYELPILLHIRKAHADALKMLKSHPYDATQLGGIAHSFSGGEQEAKAFVKLGFKLGVTGQITNPNAKKLRRAVMAAVDTAGLSCLVIETDCPDMLPVMCHIDENLNTSNTLDVSYDNINMRNTPANLCHVLHTLSELLVVDAEQLAEQLWQNSCDALRVNWTYPYATDTDKNKSFDWAVK